MSDNNVCPKCGAERNANGFIVHVANCPNITVTHWTSPIHYILPNTITIDEREYHFLQSEIARLKAELEKAERERDDAYELCETQSGNLERRAQDIWSLNNRYFEMKKERDEVLAQAEMNRQYRSAFEAEMEGTTILRKRYGARDNETFEHFMRRLVSERDEARRWARIFYRLHLLHVNYSGNYIAPWMIGGVNV